MPQSLADEFSFEFPLPIEVLLLRTLGAALLCGLIGLERGAHKNPAGLRTNMLVGLAVATFCMITLYMMETLGDGNAAMRFDPIRLVEAVTAGITFLAAGVIVFTKGDVKGLTTGASMWLSGAIGLACGLGLWPVALLASFAGIVILWLLRHLQSATGLKDE
ncbi:Protein SrpB [Pleomorphomonas sp. T1.2MG-36]|uniref:MgtC/SapB family protein n=1 Tax=Pleomorphomonas sp. T1.2MG-36 TaxID=3041167 RepID=UPI002477B323|nr:MgtC/SapB family protein [Pleomorphomonas sp. T1.2MG-36]CAI9406185.1 Protein SrpB [Pleomorphomonas sp. T1.2MG-36]